MGLTERLARASSRHPWRVLLGWLAAIVLALGLAVTLLPGNLTTNGHVTNNPESAQAERIFYRDFPPDRRGVDELIVVRSATRTVADPAFRRFAAHQGRDPGATDDDTLYFHDVPASVRAEAMRRPVEQTDGPFRDPWPLDRWPDVPTRVVAGSGDRLFPPDFVTPLARQRVGVDPDVIDTGHLAALADPDSLVDLLDRYAREVIGSP